MAKIAVLDNNMINMIAAGEVIERPASVVKEMLENSIDAGAAKISVCVEDGGQKLITVTDNGCGMSAEDIPTAFTAHATSKIRTIDDLAAISSMGFRGEALASIASVAQVKVVSRERGSVGGSTLSIDCGQAGEVMPCSSDYGTTFEVRNIFYKLPARRKFLRTVSTEMGYITEHFIRIALAHTSIEMSLTHNKRLIHHLISGQNTLERIGKLFSRDLEDCLMPVSGQEKALSIRAFISRPGVSKINNKLQYIFLNGRYIRDKFISHSIKEAYRGFIEPNKFPVAFIFLDMPYEAYDVNVHPTKTEIRFDNPNFVHSQVLAVLREKLMSTNVDINAVIPAPSQPDKSPLDEILSRVQDARSERVTDAMDSFFKNNRPALQRHFDFKPSGFPHGAAGPRRANPDFSIRQEALSAGGASDFDLALPMPPQTITDSFSQSPFLQVHDSYILVQNEQGFEIIDQHALHERIIYERLYARICSEDAGPLPSQRLLIPEPIDVSAADIEILENSRDLLRLLGITAEPFGPGSYAVQSFPVMLKDVSPSQFLRDIIDIISETGVNPDREKLIHSVLDMAACKAAIKAGENLSRQEIAHLLEEREQTPRCGRCPHGRPTSIQFTLKDLEKQFKRTGF